MQECSVYLLTRLNKFLHARTFFADTTSVLMFEMYFSWKNVLYTRFFIALYTPSYVFYSNGCNKFLHARTFFTLTDTTSIQMLVGLLFPWVQCQSLKPVLSQCIQTGFVTVDDFIALYTCSHIFYYHSCNKFLHARTFFTLTDTIQSHQYLP